MGGEREFTLPKTQPKAVGGQTLQLIQQKQNLRIHEERDRKEIHFHDDEKKIKAAVPTSVWFEAWLKISTEVVVTTEGTTEDQTYSWGFLDPTNQTQLLLEIVANSQRIDAQVSVTPLQNMEPGFKALAQFSLGK